VKSKLDKFLPFSSVAENEWHVVEAEWNEVYFRLEAFTGVGTGFTMILLM
jgi:hypothetical protein